MNCLQRQKLFYVAMSIKFSNLFSASNIYSCCVLIVNNTSFYADLNQLLSIVIEMYDSREHSLRKTLILKIK